MRGKEYIIGISESVGIILLSSLSSISPVPLLVILSIISCYKEKPWEVPATLFNLSSVRTNQLFKIFFGSIVKLVVVILTVYLTSVSPIM